MNQKRETLYILGNAFNPYSPQMYRQAQDSLEKEGFVVLNPVGNEAPTLAHKWLPKALASIFSADGVATIPGWHRSHTGIAEEEVAGGALGLLVRPYEEWITGGKPWTQ